MGPFDFSPHFSTIDSSDIDTSFFPDFETMFTDEFIHFPVLVDEMNVMLPKDDFSLDLEGFETILAEIGEMAGSLEEIEETYSQQKLQANGEDQQSLSQCLNPNNTSTGTTLSQPPLILPTDDREIDNSLRILHLWKAYGEAMEEEKMELAEAIRKCIGEKVSPVGKIVERLLYYSFQPLDKQSYYLKQESGKNFYAAFRAFYEIFPYGKFAHFAANLAILTSIPRDAEIIHIIDFDIGDGTQWASVIKAIAGHQEREIRLTSIKWSEEDSSFDDLGWSFDETKRRLLDHTRAFGVQLKVEEIELQSLAGEMKKVNRRGGSKEWLSFNCMVGLPHMGRVRKRKDVLQFLKVARELSLCSPNCGTSANGVITFGDGEDVWEISRKCSSLSSFLDGCVVHYQALLESMEYAFPIHLGEARTAMECLFVAPFVSSLAWIQKWQERKELRDFQSTCGLEGWRVSKESLMEAKEMVREGVSPYAVIVEGEGSNEMVLKWRGIPLVRVSLWRN